MSWFESNVVLQHVLWFRKILVIFRDFDLANLERLLFPVCMLCMSRTYGKLYSRGLRISRSKSWITNPYIRFTPQKRCHMVIPICTTSNIYVFHVPYSRILRLQTSNLFSTFLCIDGRTFTKSGATPGEFPVVSGPNPEITILHRACTYSFRSPYTLPNAVELHCASKI